jgi:hypothetical protein
MRISLGMAEALSKNGLNLNNEDMRRLERCGNKSRSNQKSREHPSGGGADTALTPVDVQVIHSHSESRRVGQHFRNLAFVARGVEIESRDGIRPEQGQ